MNLQIAQDAAADRVLTDHPFALLAGMMLDQQFPMERAFLSPYLLRERLDGDLDASAIASMDDAALEGVFAGPPALHRFPSSMARRCRDLCRHVADEYGGDARRIWTEASDGADLRRRLESLPGFGKAKARIFVGGIGKRLGEGPDGWDAEAADWPSIADVDEFEKVLELREHKRTMKAKARAEREASDS
jgi:uncharacterized HhH-GPD family protein